MRVGGYTVGWVGLAEVGEPGIKDGRLGLRAGEVGVYCRSSSCGWSCALSLGGRLEFESERVGGVGGWWSC